MKGSSEGGETVQVERGHILRSTAPKDRHSKVYTSKGPRDRRVRLSAHTAIQFYDVQDRLGYDRPSKAVDWLIHKAKAAIDKLNEASPSSGPDQFPFLHQIHNPTGFNNSITAPPDLNLLKSLLNNDDSVTRMSRDLGLSLHPFQESFDGWNMNSPGNSPQEAAPAVFSQVELLQANPWQTNPQARTLDLQSPFGLEFRVPGCVYGDEEPQNQEDRR